MWVFVNIRSIVVVFMEKGFLPEDSNTKKLDF